MAYNIPPSDNSDWYNGNTGGAAGPNAWDTAPPPPMSAYQQGGGGAGEQPQQAHYTPAHHYASAPQQPPPQASHRPQQPQQYSHQQWAPPPGPPQQQQQQQYNQGPVATNMPPASSNAMGPGYTTNAGANTALISSFASNFIQGAGESFVKENMGAVGGAVDRSKSLLRYYFHVNTKYVGNKLRIVLFPFSNKSWDRRRTSSQEYMLPRDDLNAPDLYIPTMGFASYVMLVGLLLGTRSLFTPESLGATASSALLWLFSEVFLLFSTFYLLNITPNGSSVHWLDLLAFCGYKYVGINVTLLSKIMFPDSLVSLCVCLYCSITVAWFTLKALKPVIMDEAHAGAHVGRKRRNYFFLIISILQAFFTYYLTRF